MLIVLTVSSDQSGPSSLTPLTLLLHLLVVTHCNSGLKTEQSQSALLFCSTSLKHAGCPTNVKTKYLSYANLLDIFYGLEGALNNSVQYSLTIQYHTSVRLKIAVEIILVSSREPNWPVLYIWCQEVARHFVMNMP